MTLFHAVDLHGKPVFVVAKNLKAVADYLAERSYPKKIEEVEGQLVLLEPLTNLK